MAKSGEKLADFYFWEGGFERRITTKRSADVHGSRVERDVQSTPSVVSACWYDTLG
jgi:hypothetical protein